MDLLSGLQAGANFATGYNQGQQQYLVNQMNQLQLQNQQLILAQNINKQKIEQNMADYAMSQWNPTVTDPATGQVIGQPSQQQVQAQRLQNMAQHAYQMGAPEVGEQYSTQLANLQAQQQRSQLERSQLQGSQLKNAGLMATQAYQDMQAFPEGIQGGLQFVAAQAAKGLDTTMLQRFVMQHPNDWKDAVGQYLQQPMTAYQKALAKNAQARIAQTQSNADRAYQLGQAKLAETTKYHQQQAAVRKASGGGAPQRPTGPEQDQALQLASQLSGKAVEVLPGDVPGFRDSPEWNAFATDAANGAAAIGKMEGIPYPQALREYATRAEAAGELPKVANPPGWLENLFGKSGTGTTTTYKPVGQSVDTAIPYVQGMPMMIGKYYLRDGHVYQYTTKGVTRIR